MRFQDLHTHTHYSDGKNDVKTMVQAACLFGLDTIALTDHCSADFPFDAARIARDVHEARQWATCRVLAGVEALVVDIEGRLAVRDEDIPLLDIVLAEMNPSTAGWSDVEDHAARAERIVLTMVNAVRRNPAVRIFAHPFNVAGQTGIDLAHFKDDLLAELGRAFAETGVAFELNNDGWWWWRHASVERMTEEYAAIVWTLKRHGVKFSLGSDAHSHQGIGNFAWSLRLMRMAGLDEQDVICIELPDGASAAPGGGSLRHG